MADHYEECDVCGERFWNEAIVQYMREVHNRSSDSWAWVCQRCFHRGS